jgi:hypothetical protein
MLFLSTTWTTRGVVNVAAVTTALGSVNLSGYSQVKERVSYFEIFFAILL